ncbi:uracil-DNA glycosylase [Candidatus Dependentiae bacterium]|nr:uracil-DNA glycosylase [Candidatus Dependentiae bacterium]
MKSNKENALELLNELKKYINNRMIVENLETDIEIKYKRIMPKKTSSPLSKDQLLEKIKKRVFNCKECELYKTKTNYVFGEGSSDAELMFIGEAPGYNEDVKGKPFVGRAGQLLEKMLNAMGLSREKVFIANILKCRPPKNRNPQSGEVFACTGYLVKQIEVIQPKVICSLGLFAGQFLLDNPMVKMGDIRGGKFEYNGITVIPTYHPAYLLRSPSQKKVVWQDMIQVMKLLGMKNKWTE